ncbi:AAA family ATPase [Sphingomonas faeni]|uniref:AAA family ATPase n=1 Tax=Sphingomonas faeni TaxID=185950 RepID=UPI00278411A9|nr:TniB family NTP-binding protein [Sphingomonas faeni]MDQ0839194.1 Cdc6-like AAA superfamily ATPase [Sphingomonas faeni]
MSGVEGGTPPVELSSIVDVRERIAEGRRRFDRIRLEHAPQRNAIDMLDDVRRAGIGRRAGAVCGGAILVAPFGTGKTCAIETLCEEVNGAADVRPDIIPVLHVKLSVAGTTDAVPTQILRALGKPKPGSGKESVRWDRAIQGMLNAGVQLALIDEFNRAARRPTMSGPIADMIQERIVDEGIAPIAIIGSEAAGSVLRSAKGLMERLDDQIDLEPMEWVHDQTLFCGFMGALDAAIVDAGILDETSGLDHPTVAENLCIASDGRLRRIMKIIRIASATAVRRGDTAMTVADLAEGVAAYAGTRRFIEDNPFEEKSN